jgi:hypothetical protein
MSKYLEETPLPYEGFYFKLTWNGSTGQLQSASCKLTDKNECDRFAGVMQNIAYTPLQTHDQITRKHGWIMDVQDLSKFIKLTGVKAQEAGAVARLYVEREKPPQFEGARLG